MTRRFSESGFVLVGVVMMVLALTILGLSLFSLSSYEAQFMNRSLDSEQALQCAIAGLDRARFALSVSPNHLEQVKSNLPYEYVVNVTATQTQGGVPDTTGPIEWGGSDITIQSTAAFRSATRTVIGNYQAQMVDNWYKRLLTVGSGGITQYSTVGGSSLPACGTVALFDSIWVNKPPPAPWVVTVPPPTPPALGCLGGSFGVNPRFVPIPTVDPFMTYPATDVPSSLSMDLNLGPPNAVHYYRTNDGPGPSGATNFSYYNALTSPVTVHVQGLAVWILPRGFRSEGEVQFVSSGNPSDCLVMIAKDGTIIQGGKTFRGGIWFFGGANSPNLPLILVSDGGVKFECFNSPGLLQLLPHLSTFADSVIITGPSQASGVLLTMHYDAAKMDTTIDKLSAAGALPNAASASPLALKPGSWRIAQ